MIVIQDIIVLVSLDTKPIPKETLLPLLLSTEGTAPYKEYTSLAKVAADFPTGKTHDCAKALFGQTELAPAPIEKCAIFGVASDATDEDIIVAIEELRKSHDDWYFLLPVESDPARILTLSEWTKKTVLSEAQIRAGQVESEKLLIAQTDSATFTSQNAQTVVCYNHDAANTYMHAAWVGRVAPNYPRAVTWKWKELVGIPLTDLEGDALHELLESSINTYARNNKRDYMREGICCDTDFIDTVMSRWQIKLNIRRKLTDFHVDNETVPYDNDGFTMVGAQIIAALEEAVTNGNILSENGVGAYRVNIPRRQDATRDQAARRIIPDITWEATLLGGVHGVTVRGTLTVRLVGGDE